MGGSVENIKNRQDLLITSEYAKNRTEKSPNSKLKDILNILNNPKLQKVKEFKELKNKINNREYRTFQKIIWVPYNKCDWKLWKETFEYFSNYIDKLKKEDNLFASIRNWLSEIWSSITEYVWDIFWNNSWWNMNENTNLTDTINIRRNEAQYLAAHETMSQSEYNKIFSWKEKLQQWQLGDCYLVSSINQLVRAQHFDTLMRTSIQRIKRKDDWSFWYRIKIPLWEPKWRIILLKDSELSVAKIRWNIWFKILELAYAKNKLRKNNKEGNKYRPITSWEFSKISWWRMKEVFETFLWKHNIWFNTFWDKKRKKPLNTISQNNKRQIIWFLKNYVPNIWNKFVSLSSIWWKSDSDKYTIGWKTMYHKHAYALTKVNKDWNWNIKWITVLNPRNSEWDWNNYLNFTVDEFFQAFSYMSCGKIKTETFLDNKSIT